MDFLPFGEQIAGDSGSTHKFTGKERDSESAQGLGHPPFLIFRLKMGANFPLQRHLVKLIRRLVVLVSKKRKEINLWNASVFQVFRVEVRDHRCVRTHVRLII